MPKHSARTCSLSNQALAEFQVGSSTIIVKRVSPALKHHGAGGSRASGHVEKLSIPLAS